MNDITINFNEEEKKLEEQLANLPKKKWQIWRLIVVGILLPLIGPYLPTRRGSRMRYEDSVLLFGIISIIAIPVGCYMHFQQVNEEMCDIERKLRHIRFKQKESEENNN